MTSIYENWIEARPAAKYAKESYRVFLERLNKGEIRAIKRGRKWLTKPEWIDEYLVGLEKTGIICRK